MNVNNNNASFSSVSEDQKDRVSKEGHIRKASTIMINSPIQSKRVADDDRRSPSQEEPVSKKRSTKNTVSLSKPKSNKMEIQRRTYNDPQ